MWKLYIALAISMYGNLKHGGESGNRKFLAKVTPAF
jgi:hypothetical protein